MLNAKIEEFKQTKGIGFKIFPLKTISQVFSIKFGTIWLTLKLKRLGETTLRSRQRCLEDFDHFTPEIALWSIDRFECVLPLCWLKFNKKN